MNDDNARNETVSSSEDNPSDSAPHDPIQTGENTGSDDVAPDNSAAETTRPEDSDGSDSGPDDSFFQADSTDSSAPEEKDEEEDYNYHDPVDETLATHVDEDAVKAIRKQWRKEKKNKRPSMFGMLLMVGVVCFVPWYTWSQREDLEYFFSSSEPIDLGSAQEYRITDNGQVGKSQEFPDNRYVTVHGIPIRQIAIKSKDDVLSRSTEKLVYQLLGSGLYIQEEKENSRFASFMSNTSATLTINQNAQEISVSGRLRRFDTEEAVKYAPIRDYYSKSYGTFFCESLSPAERKRKEALLGKGGIAIQIMPDGSNIPADTDTHETLIDVEPLRGRGGLALGKNNTLLNTTDGGLTWKKSTLKIASEATSIAHSPSGSQVVYGGRHGWVGGESYKPSPNALSISQDVLDVTFTDPEPGDEMNVPALISVGREGLLQTAWNNREGWFPARLDDSFVFNDIIRTDKRWFAAGKLLMYRGPNDASWTHGVSPVRTEWTSLAKVPGYVVATGKKGHVARLALDKPGAQWETWEPDDVPGIEFTADLNASAVSDDGKTWVAVGSEGSIAVAKANDAGIFDRIQRISGSYASYGIVRDILAGNSVEASLAEALNRYTAEDLYDVTYHGGMFWAVGADSLLMTSEDGLSWKKRQLHIKDRTLRAIRFTGDKKGVIAGEKGVMLVTKDGGETWRSRNSSTERSIYDIDTTPEFGEGFVFAGAFGLWGFCKGVDGECYVRARNAEHHYRGIALDHTVQKSGYLHVIAVGNESRIDQIDDAPNNALKLTSLWKKGRSNVTDIAFASSDLPLLPDHARGRNALIAVGDGVLYRSLDNGYTFHREESGLAANVSHIAMSNNGDIVWVFDGGGNAMEDLHGLGKWKSLPSGFIDGTFVQTIGYLIDNNCIYRRLPQAETEKVTCVDNGFQLRGIVSNGNDIVVGMANAQNYFTAKLENDRLSEPSPVTQPLSDDIRLGACGGKPFVHDLENKRIIIDGNVTENAVDAVCIQNKPTILKSESVREGVWLLSLLSDEHPWKMEVGFNPESARLVRSGSSWWLASEAIDATYPLILMSSDNGKTWSWRRNTITDFHAVATAGSYAVAVGDNSTILYSDNYGQSWTQLSPHSNMTLRDVCLTPDGSFGLAVGDGGTIYRSQNGLNHWTKLKYKFDFDITSCTIAKRENDIQIYFAGKGGVIYTMPRNMSPLELIATPILEDIYSLTTLETGEVLAVGGIYQDPATICENGFIIEADKSPKSLWHTLLLVILFGVFWIFTIVKLYRSLKRPEDSEHPTNTNEESLEGT